MMVYLSSAEEVLYIYTPWSIYFKKNTSGGCMLTLVL